MLGINKRSYSWKARLLIFCLACFLAHPAYAQTVSNLKSLLSEQGQVLFGDGPNSVLIVDYPENIARVEEYLAMVDSKPQQVHIEARVVEVKLQGETSMGIDWTAFAASGGLNFGNFDMYSGTAASGITTAGVIDYDTFSKIKDPAISGATTNTDPFILTLSQNNIDVVMRALANDYDTDILSAPSVTTLNNHEAIIQMTDIYPWAEPTVTTVEGSTPEITWDINFEEAGIILRVTPTISEDGQIAMDLMPEISEKTTDYDLTVDPVGGSQITYTVPVIETRQAKTKVLVNSGETLIIGGLIKNKEVEAEIKIPLLGDIPYLGYLFKTKKTTRDKRELVIFVSPTIINAPEVEYSAKLEKRIRADIEGSESKLEMIPLKEVGGLKAKRDSKLAAKTASTVVPEAVASDKALAERISSLHEQALGFYKAGKLDQANKIFEEILYLDPTDKTAKNYLAKSIKALYAQGVSNFARNQLDNARVLFEAVLRYDPGHKKALHYLEVKIPEKIKENKLLTSLEKKPAAAKVSRGVAEAAEVTKEKVEVKEEVRLEPKVASEKLTEEQIAEQKVSQLYKEARSLYRAKKYSQAYEKFQELNNLKPGWKKTKYYLSKLPRLVEREQRKLRAKQAKQKEQDIASQAKASYQSALALYLEGKYPEAYAQFEAVQKLIPGYRETTYYLNKIKAMNQSEEKISRGQAIQEMLNACE